MMRIEGIKLPENVPVRLYVDQGIVQCKEIIERVSDESPYIAPAFFDLQVNGYKGVDYSDPELNEEKIITLCRNLFESGTLRHLPTVITNSEELILRNLKMITSARKADKDVHNAIPGIHVEGPFISSTEGPRGTHDPQYVRAATLEEVERWIEAAEGSIKIVTIAPEQKGVLEIIPQLVRKGIIVGIGHSEADPALINEAVAAGASYSTHLGNGLSSYIPRLENLIWKQLALDKLRAGIISDGFHLPPYVVSTIVKAKTLKRIALTSDVAYLAGSKPGTYVWGEMPVEVYEDGHLGVPNTSCLAGSGHLLDWGVPHFSDFTGLGIGAAIQAASVNPCQFMALDESVYSIHQGAPADFIVFDYKCGDEKIRLKSAFLRGEKII